LSRNVNKGVYISRKIFFLATTASDTHCEFNIIKRNDLSKINAEYIIIVNETDVLAYERATGELLKSTKEALYKRLEFFFPLLGKPRSLEFSVVAADRKAAEQLAQLHGALVINNPNATIESINAFICNFLFCSFIDSA